jgi:hypothetical protein
MRKLFSPALLIFSLIMFCSQPGLAQSGAAKVEPTEISAGLGVCSALINVTGADSKPVYKAKVSTRIHYGVMGVKRLDLETYTSTAGQVKIIQLPELPKKPVYIYISKDDKMETVEFKPDVRCQASYDVELK